MSAQRKPGLSRDEHVALGEELSAMRDRMGEIAALLSSAYPVATARAAASIQQRFDKLRSELDAIVFSEYPRFDSLRNARVYYPGPSVPATRKADV
jgi:hypothetical protein